MRFIQFLLCDEDGATAVEYAVMLALVILVCVGVISSIGQQTSSLMDPDGKLSGAMKQGASSS